MEDRLKPCPFCGGDAEVREIGYKSTVNSTIRFYIAECQCCCANFERDTKEAAIEAWNTRKPIDRIVEQLEESSKNFCREYALFEDENVLYLPDAIEIVKAGGKGEE